MVKPYESVRKSDEFSPYRNFRLYIYTRDSPRRIEILNEAQPCDEDNGSPKVHRMCALKGHCP